MGGHGWAGPASAALLDPAVGKEMEALAKGGVLSRSDFNERVRIPLCIFVLLLGILCGGYTPRQVVVSSLC